MTHRNHQPAHHGLSLVEVVASTMIVSMMAVAALNSLGAATRSAQSIGNRAIAAALADHLMSEILQAAYVEPTGVASFGPESGEVTGTRSAFDDVDDFNNWSMSPPQYRDGTNIPDRDDWRQRIVITRVNPANPTQASATETGAKRIRIVIDYQDHMLAEQYAIRTNTDDN